MLLPRFWKNFRILLIIALTLMIACICALGHYARPLADDLTQPYPVVMTWKQTGSILETIRAAFHETAELYRNWSGIFFSMFLSVLPLSMFTENMSGGGYTFLSVLLFVSAVWHIGSLLRVMFPTATKEVTDCAWLLLAVFMLLLMPDYYEGFFWFSGAANYIIPMSLAIHLFASLLKCFFGKNVVTGRLPGWCVGFFCVGGSNWMTPTSALVVWGVLILWVICCKKDKKLLLPFLFLLAGYLVALAAPGNASRSSRQIETLPLFSALPQSLGRGLHLAFSDVRYVLFTLLLVPVIIELYPHASFQSRFLWLAPVLSVCVLGAACFPLIYKCVYFAPRHLDTCFVTLALLLPIDLYWLMGYVIPFIKGRKASHTMAYLSIIVLMIGLASLKGTTLKPFHLNVSLEPVRSAYYLVNGSAKAFAEDYDEMAETIRANQGESVVLETAPYHAMLCKKPLVSENGECDPMLIRFFSFVKE